MKIRKNVLADALKVLGKACSQTSPVEFQRMVRFVGTSAEAVLMATDGVEVVALTVEAEGVFDFGVELKALREVVRTAKNEVELQGIAVEWPEVEVVPVDAVEVALPEDFGNLLALAAPVVDRLEARRTLQGINLSADGVTVTDGKQLLNLPCSLDLPEEITLPFPHALLAAKPAGKGVLQVWHVKEERLFRVEIGNFVWQGKALPGAYPNWRQVVPMERSLDCHLTILEPERVIDFLKVVPDQPPFHAVELQMTQKEVTFISVVAPNMKLQVEAELIGAAPTKLFALNKHILLRMLQQGYKTFATGSDGNTPVLATGGYGRFIAMPVRASPNNVTHIQPVIQKEEPQMEATKPMEPVESVNVMDELNAAVDDLRGKLKMLFDESASLTRKVKEAVLAQKQKEREFIQARRAIERIKMAI